MDNLFVGIKRFFQDWNDHKINKNYFTVEKIGDKRTHNPLQYLTFQSLFDSPEQYEIINEILVKRKMLNPINGGWIDFRKGNKQQMIGILKKLHRYGYFKRNIKMSKEQIQAVCLNSFGVDISLEYIKRVQSEDVYLDFIPVLVQAPKKPNHIFK